MISFIIPAYNEEALISQTVQLLRASANAVLGDREYEIIVVNDHSSDRTAETASEAGARVVDVKRRQISAVRNAGAKAAHGDVFAFVDADTLVSVAVLREVMNALRHGAVGGGSWVEFEGRIPLVAKVLFHIFMLIWRPLNLAAGCFVFARRSAFEAVGGFDEQFFASEEVWISKALKSQGRFVVVREPVITSGRKMRLHTPWQILWLMLRLMWKGPAGCQQREGLDLWYDGKREAAPITHET